MKQQKRQMLADKSREKTQSCGVGDKVGAHGRTGNEGTERADCRRLLLGNCGLAKAEKEKRVCGPIGWRTLVKASARATVGAMAAAVRTVTWNVELVHAGQPCV